MFNYSYWQNFNIIISGYHLSGTGNYGPSGYIVDNSGFYGSSGWSNTGIYGELIFTSIPDMTSDTSPYGIASISNPGTQQGWYAFATTDGFSTSISWTVDDPPLWAMYQFPQPTYVYGISYYTYENAGITFNLQGSNDGINFINLGLAGSGNNGNPQGIYSNSEKYIYFRVFVTNTEYGEANVQNIQMYGYYTI